MMSSPVFSCISAARKGRPNIVFGNIAGSQIFNLLGILGVTALVTEIVYSRHLAIDTALLVVATLVLLALARSAPARRVLPVALLAIYGIYGGYLVYVSG